MPYVTTIKAVNCVMVQNSLLDIFHAKFFSGERMVGSQDPSEMYTNYKLYLMLHCHQSNPAVGWAVM